MEVPLVHCQHLRAKLQLIIQYHTPPEFVIVLFFVLTWHINQLGSLVFLFLLLLLFTIFFCFFGLILLAFLISLLLLLRL